MVSYYVRRVPYRHLPRVYDYLWLAEDGLKMQGYNGSQLWDTSFAVQVCVSAHGACVLWGRWVVQGLQRQPAVGHVLRGAGVC